MAYTICNLDRMSGTEDSSLLVSLKYFDKDGKPAAIENGSIVKLGDFVDGEREMRKAVAPTADTAIKDVVLVANPEVIYDESRYHGLEDYINEADQVIRGYRFHANDGFSVTKEGFDTTPNIGNYVVVGDTTKLKLSAEATGTVIGKIIDKWATGPDEYFYVQVTM